VVVGVVPITAAVVELVAIALLLEHQGAVHRLKPL
jgi:hypothetical protein